MAESQTRTIACAFCKGSGRDPYDQLSWLSRCEACQGRGEVEAPEPHVRCVYCGGTGSHKTYRCLVCGGKGVLAPLLEPKRPCPECEGLSYEASSGLRCERCRGRGEVRAETQEVGQS